MHISCEKKDLLGKEILYIGRFQPFHLGHLDAVRQAIDAGATHIYIVIGSAQESGTQKNPRSASHRREMILSSLDISGIPSSIYSLSELDDMLGDDDAWFQNLQKTYPHFDLIMSGNPWLHDICTQMNIPRYDPFSDENRNVDISATQIREWIEEGEWEKVREYVVGENFSFIL